MEKKNKYTFDKYKTVNISFISVQLDIILKALIIYKIILEQLIDIVDIGNNEKNDKINQITFLYEQIRATINEQNDISTNKRNYFNIKEDFQLNSTELKIIKLIDYEKYITEQDLAKILGMSANCIYKNLRKLKIKNLITRVGGNKNGFWKLNI